VNLTSYGSFFLTANEGMAPSFWVSAQWKIFWYSVGSDSCAGIMNRKIQWLVRLLKTEIRLEAENRGERNGREIPLHVKEPYNALERPACIIVMSAYQGLKDMPQSKLHLL